MNRMLLVIKRSDAQESSLRQLLDDQQDKSSASYHKWLTPEDYGKQFGPTDTDLQTITAWLQSHGFQVGSTKGRTVLEFSGSAGQVQEAFHATIHKYIVNGDQHWANSSDPQIPTSLTPAVGGVLTLHNFIKKPTIHLDSAPVLAQLAPGKRAAVTFPATGGAIHALSPQDYRTIYNASGVSVGGNVTIAVVGRSNIYNGGADISAFQSLFGAAAFFVVLDGPDPGDLGGGEEAEATLDSSWSGALAPGGTVRLVVSATTNSTDGVDLSEAYIIEQNFAEIMTESFSSCELYATDAQLLGATNMAEQAAAQGITYFVSTGDNGTAGCDDPSVAPATHPVSVNFLASTAFNVAVGGTMFNENGLDSKYWGSAPPVQESALSYIPENVWNESSLTNGLAAGSGGASAGNIGAGGTTSGVAKPNWQYGVTGIPTDGVRDLPDVSLTAASHDPYLLCLEGSCSPNSQGQFYVYFVSGTSAAAPSMAGIMALVDDESSRITGQFRQGLANYVLYRLAALQTAYPSQCNGSSTSTPPVSACIFNDVSVGNNVVPGETGIDYQATAGYDLATGLGSVNITNLVNEWNTVTFNPTTTNISLGLSSLTHGTPMPFTVTVTPSGSGNGVPTGEIFLYAQGPFGYAPLPTTIGPFGLSGGMVSTNTDSLPGGNYLITAGYSGDSNFAPSISPGTNYITVNTEDSTTSISVLTADQNGNAIPFTNGPFGSFVYLRADVAGKSGYGIPTGTVSFLDNGNGVSGGYALSLNSQGNTATPNGVLGFDTGTHAISASYSGDSSFNPSTSIQPLSFTITPGFFASFSPATSTLVLTSPGTSGQLLFSVLTSTSFNGTISLACSGLPSEATCIFSPATITATGSPLVAAPSVTVTTTAPTAMLRQPKHNHWPNFLTVASFTFGFVLLAGNRRRCRFPFVLPLVILLMFVPGCGGGSSNSSSTPISHSNAGTPKGTYNVVVTATSGSVVSTTGFTLVLQ